MTDKRRPDTTDLLSSTRWEMRIPKRCVLPEAIEIVHHRLTQLYPVSSDRAAGAAILVPYAEVVVSPLYIVISPNPADVDALLGPRDAFVPPPSGLSEAEASVLLRRMVAALLRLHSRRVVHGHCDSDSFLIHSGEKEPRLVMVDHPIPLPLLSVRSRAGAFVRRCAAPEVERNESLTYAADAWAVGVLLLRLTLPGGNEFITADLESTDLLSPFLSSLSSVARSLLVQCLAGEPSKRPTLWEVLEHPFFSQADAGEASDGDADAASASEPSSGGDDGDLEDSADDAATSSGSDESSDESGCDS